MTDDASVDVFCQIAASEAFDFGRAFQRAGDSEVFALILTRLIDLVDREGPATEVMAKVKAACCREVQRWNRESAKCNTEYKCGHTTLGRLWLR